MRGLGNAYSTTTHNSIMSSSNGSLKVSMLNDDNPCFNELLNFWCLFYEWVIPIPQDIVSKLVVIYFILYIYYSIHIHTPPILYLSDLKEETAVFW